MSLIRIINIPTLDGALTVDLHKLAGIELDSFDGKNYARFALDGGNIIGGYLPSASDVTQIENMWFAWVDQFVEKPTVLNFDSVDDLTAEDFSVG